MQVARTIDELSSALAGGHPVFIPTMGALHEGHLALIRQGGRLAEAQRPSVGAAAVVVSIFVNPTQFGPNEDYTRYPRMLEQDISAAATAGADIVFAPEVDVIYPANLAGPLYSRLPSVATEPKLEDAHRPTHFAGVCQVVARLFDLVRPSAAIFGEKDYQQLKVIEALVREERDRWPELRIETHPTVREVGGLAMSSRNAYLSPEQRESALGIKRALDAANIVELERAEAEMREVLESHELRIDYAVVRDARTLMVARSAHGPLRALIAARVGNVRLIDNAPIVPQ